ncbi:MAG: YraN family protein [SAR324 cluster bacterium]|uniref:YraN family protein n=1 Tax=SAR324 cluster bacterium TaxID=2024889 RepID=A0A7X9FQ05_9DELT|nr:YraN family protein [SAR324 cluster bacterium]
MNIPQKIKILITAFIKNTFLPCDFILVLPLKDIFIYVTPFFKSEDRAIGLIGEQIAVQLLENKKIRLIDRNWHGGGGEIDIVAYQNKCVVFCEVKTRKEFKPNFYPALAAIN